tara:strand:+ start:6587 stop:10207 length:3621 start_codon:yes stop_codon:yes gene_type:complete
LTSNSLDILTVPLEGMILIEASAGTGKTYAITSLYIRLLLERNLSVKNILVVTYTRAATHDLRKRIRQKVQSTLRALEDKSNMTDSWLSEFLRDPLAVDQAHRNLRRALLEFDQAAIFTMHGFCQQVLSETSFETGQTFFSELIPDETELLEEVVNDFWRKEIYSASRLWVSWLQYKKILRPRDLQQIVRNILGKPYLNFVIQDNKKNEQYCDQVKNYSVEQLEENVNLIFRKLASIWKDSKDLIAEVLISDRKLNRVRYPKSSIPKWIDDMDLLLESRKINYNFWKKLVFFKKFCSSFQASGQATTGGGSPPKHIFFDVCDELNESLAQLESGYQEKFIIWKGNLLKFVNQKIRERKSRLQVKSYDDLLLDLQYALQSQTGAQLIEKFQREYVAILIDEFQDTDPVQLNIFRSMHHESRNPFFMVGDPKQAIYSFRGADIFSYLTAHEIVDAKYTLMKNYRSVTGLVNAVNLLFTKIDKVDSFFFKEIEFSEVSSLGTIPEYSINAKISPPMVIWPIRGKEQKKDLSKEQARDDCAKAVGAEVVRILNGNATLGDRLVGPDDIAILVRTHYEGELVENTLERIGIPCMRNLQKSVYQTDEVTELQSVLMAIEKPRNLSLIKTALLTSFYDYDVQDISNWSEMNQFSHAITDEFQRYRDSWSKNGLMRMFREFASANNIFQRLLSLKNGDRKLTNIFHLVELIEARFGTKHDLHLVIIWLSKKLKDSTTEDKEALIRLESDCERVKIMTLHTSKGLQFPIVFLPFSWEGEFQHSHIDTVLFHDAQKSNALTVDFGSQSKNFEKNRLRASEEQLAENLRLLYVGLTRAESRCYFTWGPVKGADTSALAWLFHRPQGMPIDGGRINHLKEQFPKLIEEDYLENLNSFAQQAPKSIMVEKMPILTDDLVYDKYPIPELAARKIDRQIKQAWSLASFSSLTAGRNINVPDYDATGTLFPASDKNSRKDIFSFPKGMRSGICIHKIFEEIDFSERNAEIRKATVEAALRLYGFKSSWLEVINNMLLRVLDTPLDLSGSMFLKSIDNSRRIDEMAFFYPITEFRSIAILSILKKHRFFENRKSTDLMKEISFDAIPGFMNGYIDLIFESKGKFWIVDYKSNHLGDGLNSYRLEKLSSVMIEEQYFLQYLIYVLALHRFLSQKLSGYQYDKHFGGVYYLFVRGIDPNYPGNGVFFDRPSHTLIEDLNNLIGGK